MGLKRRFRRSREGAGDPGGFVIFESTATETHYHFGDDSTFGLDDIEIVLDITTEPLTEEMAAELVAQSGIPRGIVLVALKYHGRYCKERGSVFYTLDEP